MALKYTVISRDSRLEGDIYHVFVDNTAGFSEFVEERSGGILPGSTVDIADVKAVFRLRHDGNWEKIRSYAANEEEEADLEASAVSELLDSMIPDDEIEEDGTE